MAGFIVRTAVPVPASVAEMVLRVEALTDAVVTVKLALVWSCETTTLCGTLTAALLLARNAATPPGSAAMVSVTVPRAARTPVTALGLSASVDTAKMGGVPHTPTTPPPPQVCPPKVQPHRTVPPQPSGSVPHAPPDAPAP